LAQQIGAISAKAVDLDACAAAAPQAAAEDEYLRHDHLTVLVHSRRLDAIDQGFRGWGEEPVPADGAVAGHILDVGSSSIA